MSFQIALFSHARVSIVVAPIMYFNKSYLAYKHESKVVVLRFKLGLTLHEAKQIAHRQGFSQSTLKLYFASIINNCNDHWGLSISELREREQLDPLGYASFLAVFVSIQNHWLIDKLNFYNSGL